MGPELLKVIITEGLSKTCVRHCKENERLRDKYRSSRKVRVRVAPSITSWYLAKFNWIGCGAVGPASIDWAKALDLQLKT